MSPHVAEVARFTVTTVGAGLALAGAIMCCAPGCTPAQQQKLRDARTAAEVACADLAKYGGVLNVVLPAAPAAAAVVVDAGGE